MLNPQLSHPYCKNDFIDYIKSDQLIFNTNINDYFKRWYFDKLNIEHVYQNK